MTFAEAAENSEEGDGSDNDDDEDEDDQSMEEEGRAGNDSAEDEVQKARAFAAALKSSGKPIQILRYSSDILAWRCMKGSSHTESCSQSYALHNNLAGFG